MADRNKLSLFSPSVIRKLKDSSYTFRNVTRSQLTASMPDGTTEVWRNDPQGVGMKSTQQIDLDWSKFENHCFFNSAESKVNVSFDRIINYYPFDGSKMEMVEFVDGLTGYEKDVFDRLPKFFGSLSFDKDEGQYLYFEDKSGYLFPEISRNVLGERVIGNAILGGGSTIEFCLKIPGGETFDNQVVFQKLNTTNNQGMSIFLSGSSAAFSESTLVFAMTSGSNSHLTGTMNIPRGAFHHIACVYDNDSTETLRLFLDGVQKSSSPNEDFGKTSFLDSNIYIGSGSAQTFGTLEFLPVETFSGSLDELRVWNYPRSLQEIDSFRKRNVFADDALALYYRFNEPTGSYTSKDICLDHSGNGLHGQIQSYTDAMRVDSGYSSSLPYERSDDNPVLFPDYSDLATLNSELMVSASRYDVNNPNMITKLLPAHYFLEGQAEEGMTEVDGNLGDAYSYHADTVFPGGGGKIPTVQVLSSFLFIWASFFDEIKIYLDAFSKLETVDHVAENTIPSQFLESLANKYGFTLPNAFSDIHPSQLLDGEGLGLTEEIGESNLKYIQTMLWRRLLTELPGIRREKGTISSVKSMMRSLGVNPDNSFRIREYGGRRASRFELSRKEVRKVISYLDFSKGTPFLSSSNLRAWRHAPGAPFGGPTPPDVTYDGGTIAFTIGGTPPAETLFTSSSWAWEGHYKMPKRLSTGSLQSLFRLETSGSANPEPAIVVNLLAVSGSEILSQPSLLKLVFSGSTKAKLLISGSIPELFDGNIWYINVNHSAGHVSSSFSVRASQTNGQFVMASHVFSGSYLNDTYENNYLTNYASGGNTKGVFVAIGSSSNHRTKAKYPGVNDAHNLLNGLGATSNGFNFTPFEGGLSNPRFWSKALTKKEALEHSLNPFSVGVHNPLVNYNFVKTADHFEKGRIEEREGEIGLSGSIPFGSWERLRFRTDLNQEITSSDDAGQIKIIDQSQNNISFNGIGFTADVGVIAGQFKSYSMFDPSFDIPTNINKVRIRSVIDPELALEINAESGQIFELDPRETVNDDRRFSVEASIVQAVNEDIVNLFSDEEFLSDILGSPESMFAVNYPRLERLADKYFERLTGKINHKEFFEFFKWFDDNFSVLIEKLMPRTTNFLGVNFVIESHLLERPKFDYKQADVHIDLKARLAARIEPEFLGIIRTENQ